jgi:hypothetical protein
MGFRHKTEASSHANGGSLFVSNSAHFAIAGQDENGAENRLRIHVSRTCQNRRVSLQRSALTIVGTGSARWLQALVE